MDSTVTTGRPRHTLVTDFDGTITRHDFFELALEHLVPEGTPDYFGEYLRGQRTLFDTLRDIFASIRAGEFEVLRVAEAAEPDPALAEAVVQLRLAGWEVVVASAGCAWYIHHILAKSGVCLEVHASPGQFETGRGLVMEAPAGSPYFSPTRGIDKAAVVRAALARGRTAFAGDSQPDLEAARPVEPGLRFARAGLAQALQEEGLTYRHFERWSDIARALAPGGLAP
jgi:HAD superfamily phosphoserine phosphatase-like hydrolase